MSNFFQQIRDRQLLDDAPVFFDWLFDDKKFKKEIWDRTSKSRYTKKLKRLEGFGNGTFKIRTNKDSYPDNSTKRRKRSPYALFSCEGSEGQEFVRHIRNAIAHGHAEIYRVNGKDFIELKDFRGYRQTSYIAMPVGYLESIYLSYREVEIERLNNQKGRF